MADYALAISDDEVERYRFMAERARVDEAEFWERAGIRPGAVVADVGAGPAAVSVVLARIVGPAGRVTAVEREESARAAARSLVAAAGVDNVELLAGTATDTGIPPRSVDVVVMRHVLAHNGPDEQRIVDHLAGLVRPGGSVYLVDVDGTAFRVLDGDPDLEDLDDAYQELHRRRGNDLRTGLRLAQLLTRAGLPVVLHEGRYTIARPPPGVRPPSWAARDALVAEGLATDDDVRRWAAAFARTDAAAERPTYFAPVFVALGTAPGDA
ncbi:MAG TPA: methyltransferase domain-containing protein [Geodermatophilus sp.]|nr:methyltransferase domain-containing protein [Geodermatophilus sp.]